MLFKSLTESEEREFRQWARDHYKKFQPIAGIWHPVVQDECVKINEETGYSPRADIAREILEWSGTRFDDPMEDYNDRQG
jgi:hypothetical protein